MFDLDSYSNFEATAIDTSFPSSFPQFGLFGQDHNLGYQFDTRPAQGPISSQGDRALQNESLHQSEEADRLSTSSDDNEVDRLGAQVRYLKKGRARADRKIKDLVVAVDALKKATLGKQLDERFTRVESFMKHTGTTWQSSYNELNERCKKQEETIAGLVGDLEKMGRVFDILIRRLSKRYALEFTSFGHESDSE